MPGAQPVTPHRRRRIVVLRRGEKVADKPVAQSSPEEVTGLIMGAIEMA
jgi:simple sugar transport system ATP-binding protein